MLPVIRLLSFPRARGCRWALQAVVCCEPSEAPLVWVTSAAPPPRCRGGFSPVRLWGCCWCRSPGAGTRINLPPQRGPADPRRCSTPCKAGVGHLSVGGPLSASGRALRCCQRTNPPSAPRGPAVGPPGAEGSLFPCSLQRVIKKNHQAAAFRVK